MIAGVLVTIVVWTKLGVVWGIVAGFFLIGGVGWKLLLAIPGALVNAFSRGRSSQFVKAWEERAGEMEFGQPGTYPPGGLYQAWRRESKETGISAADWLERGGLKGRPKDGERKVMSGWRYDFPSFDKTGKESQLGSQYAARRSFDYGIGGPGGTGLGMIHSELCGHSHESPENAQPCLRAFQRLDDEPSLDHVGRKHPPVRPGLVGQAISTWKVDGTPSGGDVYTLEDGLVVPWVSPEGVHGMMQVAWTNFHRAWRGSFEGRPSLVVEAQVGSVEITDFGEQGQEAWERVLGDHGVKFVHD